MGRVRHAGQARKVWRVHNRVQIRAQPLPRRAGRHRRLPYLGHDADHLGVRGGARGGRGPHPPTRHARVAGSRRPGRRVHRRVHARSPGRRRRGRKGQGCLTRPVRRQHV